MNQIHVIRLFVLFLSIVTLNYSSKGQSVLTTAEQVSGILQMKTDSVKVDSLITFYKRLADNDDLITACKYFNEAILVANSINDKGAVLELHSILGNIYKNHAEFDKAMSHQNKAMELAENLKSNKDLAIVYNFIGVIYKEQSDFINATSYQLKALKCYEELRDSSGISKTLMNLGILSKNQGTLKEAIEFYRKAEFIYLKIERKDGLAIVWANMAIAFAESGANDSAYSYMIKSIESNKKATKAKSYVSNITILGNILLGLAVQAEKSNSVIKADTCYSSAEKYFMLAIEMGNDYYKGMNSINLATLYTYKKRYDEARKGLENGLKFFQKLESKKYLPNTYLRFAVLDSTMAADSILPLNIRIEHAFQALHYINLYNQIQLEINNEESNKRTAELKIKYETEKKDIEISLLNKENEVQNISNKQKAAALLILKLKDQANTKALELASILRKSDELKLAGINRDLEAQMLKSELKNNELLIAKSEQVLQKKQLDSERLYRLFLIGIFVILLVLIVLVFRWFKLRKRLEKQEALIHQRKVISADLHDDVGSTLSSISIYSEAIKHKLNENDHPKVIELVNKIGDNARETIGNLSDIVWSINPINDNPKIYFERMESFAFSLLTSKNIQLKFTCEESVFDLLLPVEVKHNVYLIFKEAINNAVKYSEATIVVVLMKFAQRQFHLLIEDNGVGFLLVSDGFGQKVSQIVSSKTEYVMEGNGGNGIRNMHLRAQQVNGTLKMESSSLGTKMELLIPMD